ncbi:DUF3768 domain-containing protein [Phenylobacterium sp.]|uniref:DUF3768 domain-containing protein n=1 Tax=Phenylobacterium sp. TaxID=1871053 RepID=UPI002BC6B100|nr:DUF3768 domain-containing protein [Phenylobacterium sp.]HLZ77151.1 DUF3768 domain-containing protein [Phenylobacterium sp.]
MTDDERTARIRALNDRLRRDDVGGRRMITAGVAELGPLFVYQTIEKIRSVDSFDDGDDPYQEHDFGSVDVCGIRLFWKIDYYDPSFTQAAEDPADETVCGRLLTVMLAEEY